MWDTPPTHTRTYKSQFKKLKIQITLEEKIFIFAQIIYYDNLIVQQKMLNLDK